MILIWSVEMDAQQLARSKLDGLVLIQSQLIQFALLFVVMV